ncbi:hypothetical protein Mal64_19860 [Pseudobythopirellula maris]|uniref:GxxExxY protein n=1 Tax=Pseudobythopirellula maris TaxID=2527991 RepID=A0A5C5ZQE1_9BACT|nr:GxxExxY protein [Pseudobythopirellula maris]TWT88503.1 hypothetical protein Mal64_19860 [Pseudobythopirellula maris]
MPEFEPIPEGDEKLAKVVLDAAFRVHTKLGPGLLESVYEQCLCHELLQARILFQSQLMLPIQYDQIVIDAGLRLDLLVGERTVVELKAVESVLPIHKAQLFTYLKLTKCRLGLLLNFNVPQFKHGFTRVVC